MTVGRALPPGAPNVSTARLLLAGTYASIGGICWPTPAAVAFAGHHSRLDFAADVPRLGRSEGNAWRAT